MKRLFYAIILLSVFIFGLTFAARNPQTVHISYYFGIDVELPLIFVLLASLAIGLIAGYLLAAAHGLKRRRRLVHKIRSESKKVESSVRASTNALAPRNS